VDYSSIVPAGICGQQGLIHSYYIDNSLVLYALNGKCSVSSVPRGWGVMSKRFEDYAPGARAIIRAAERLFGRHGLDGVSLRQIVVAAGQVNPSAVQHHFGSKRGLIQAVYEMRTPLIEAARQARLNSMRGKTTIKDLLAAHLGPIIEVLPNPDRVLYARFMLRLLPLSDAEHPHFSCLDICTGSVELVKRMLACYPRLAPDIVTTRIRMAVCVFLQGICDERRVRGLSSHAYRTEDMYWDEIFQIALSVFGNPYPAPSLFGSCVTAAKGKAPRTTARRRTISSRSRM
jgi:AcrR family transcriptional regulator